MMNAEEKLDTRRRIELAEGVEVNLRVAGPFVRAYAFALDLVIRILIITVGGIVVGVLGIMTSSELGSGLALLMFFLVTWFYMVLFEAGKRGATPGKRAMKLRVVQPSGAPITLGQAVVRNLLRFADMMPVPTYGAGMMCLLFTKRFQRLGDLAANTLVVYDKTFIAPGSAQMRYDVQPVVPPAALTRSEEAALVSFAERSAHWSDERRAELADFLSDLSGDTGEKGANRLCAMGLWLQAEK